MSLTIGDALPRFDLPAADGTRHAVPGEATATVVVFTCNHCPYALAWHERIVAVARDYAARGVRMLQVNSNDAERYPRDSLEAMAERVGRERAGRARARGPGTSARPDPDELSGAPRPEAHPDLLWGRDARGTPSEPEAGTHPGPAPYPRDSSRFRILPVAFRGSSSRKRISRGTL
jgi:hypothetical protein